jgi:hypothetical protein
MGAFSAIIAILLVQPVGKASFGHPLRPEATDLSPLSHQPVSQVSRFRRINVAYYSACCANKGLKQAKFRKIEQK